jgi:Protein of unknown function, DUF481
MMPQLAVCQEIKDSLALPVKDTLALKMSPAVPQVTPAMPHLDSIAPANIVEKTVDKIAEKAVEKALPISPISNPISNAIANPIKAIGLSTLQDLFYELALNFRVSRGNQNYTNLMPQMNVGFENQLVGLKTDVMYNYAELDGRVLNGDLWAKNALIILPKSKLPIQWLAGGESSKIRQLPSRYQTGLGVNLNLMHTEINQLHLGLNGVYDRTRYEGKIFDNDAVETTNIRSIYGPLVQLSGRHELNAGHILLTYDVSTLVALNKKNDYRFNAISVVSFPLFHGIDLRATMIYSYENVILQGTKPSDLFLTFGLGYGKF